MKEEELAK